MKMKMTEYPVSGPKLLELVCYPDSRGFFVERYKQSMGADFGLPEFVQDNFSRSVPGVLRGLHYQWDLPQGKLVTALSGRIFDVAVDIRRDSPTFGQSISVELEGDRPAWFWIPAGFAHGFQVLGSEPADVMYKVTAPHGPNGEGGILWSDPALGISWPATPTQISDKDVKQPSWSAYKQQCRF